MPPCRAVYFFICVPSNVARACGAFYSRVDPAGDCAVLEAQCRLDEAMLRCVEERVTLDPALVRERYAGRTVLHEAFRPGQSGHGGVPSAAWRRLQRAGWRRCAERCQCERQRRRTVHHMAHGRAVGRRHPSAARRQLPPDSGGSSVDRPRRGFERQHEFPE